MNSERPPPRLEQFERFEEVVRVSCGAPERWSLPEQVRYLKEYLLSPCQGRTPQTVVVESEYTDRHYLEEFTAYYANTLHPPASRTTRLHVFTLGSDETRGHLSEAFRGAERHGKAEKALNEAYLGYVTVRPLPSAPIGRTVLAFYRDPPRRNYEASSTSHMLALT